MMKTRCASLILILMMLLPAVPALAWDTGVLVFIEEGAFWQVENNGIRVKPGEDAVFTVLMDRGVMLTGTDHVGETLTETDGRTVTLTLKDIRYPTRVRLSVSTKYCTVIYHANGGTSPTGEETVSKRYSLSTHPRPNTETDLFAREGYTLLGWNTRSDARGERIGLGSRVTPANGETELYAQWALWSDGNDFDRTGEEEAVITGYHGQDDPLVVPAYLDGRPVTAVTAGAFTGCEAKEIILPSTVRTVEDGAFRDCALTTLTLFDSIENISDAAFIDCPALTTLRINAAEAPYGYIYRKESVYADKAELLIAAQGKKKLVFYAGCSVWYNLDAIQADRLYGEEYAVINMGLNGTVSSSVQLQIMERFLEEGDVLFHTPEISSPLQLMTCTDMGDNDSSLWCGLENNYDLFALVDLSTVGGVFSSLCHYLDLKDRRTDYQQFISDDYRTPYIDKYGSVPFYRSGSGKRLDLSDRVFLDPERVSGASLDTLTSWYARLTRKGVTVLVSHACVNMDAVPEEQRGNAEKVDSLFRERVEAVPGVRVISRLTDYLYRDPDFYDTNYHLNSEPAKKNTARWMEDLKKVLPVKEAAEDAE